VTWEESSWTGLDGGDSLARSQESNDLAGQGDAIDGVGHSRIST
jgi:hypothetical protein